jgi:hypothetical protein
MANLFGPIEGRRHDVVMLPESALQEQLQQYMRNPNGDAFVLYGDPAYPLSTYITVLFRGGVISARQALFNKKMSTFFGLCTTEETESVEMCIWCIKINIVLALYFSTWVEASAGGQCIHKGVNSPARTVSFQFCRICHFFSMSTTEES